MSQTVKKPWYRRATPWVLLSIVLVLVAARLALHPLAKHYTQKGLDQMKGYQGVFDDVSISLWRGSYTITKIKITEEPATEKKKPVVYAENVEARLLWRELFRGHLTGVATVNKAKANVLIEPQPEPTPEEKAKKEREKEIAKQKPLPDLEKTLYNIVPFRVDRVELKECEVLVVDTTEATKPRIWVHDIEMSFENFATRKHLTKGQPATFALSAILQKTGKISVFASADVLEKKPTFAGQASLKDLALRDMYEFMAAKTGVQAEKGSLDVFVSFKSKDGMISGGVKPILKNVEIAPAEPTLGSEIKAKVANAALKLVSDRVPGRNAVATVLPIEGRLKDPDIQIVPAILGVVRNAFVQGVSSGYSSLPAPKDNEQKGVLSQAKEALKKDNGPPKAQPPKKKDTKKL